MIHPRSRHPGATTLHRVWSGTVITLLFLMVSVGVVAAGAAQYQRTAVRNSLAQTRSQMSAQAALSEALLGLNDPATKAMLYGTGEAHVPREVRIGYEVVRSEIDAAFDTASDVMIDPALKPITLRARQTWTALDAAVLAAPDLVASGATAEAMARGERSPRSLSQHRPQPRPS